MKKVCGIVSEWNRGARRFYAAFGAVDYSTGVPESERQHYMAADSDSVEKFAKIFKELYDEREYDGSDPHISPENLRQNNSNL